MYSNENEEAIEEKELQEKVLQESENLKLAVVTEILENGCAKVQFFGEDVASDKEYAYLYSYIDPQINDNVLMARIGKTYVILGKIVRNTKPSAGGLTITGVENIVFAEILNSSAIVKYGDHGQLDIDNATGYYNAITDLKVRDELYHTGSYLGFYGHSTARQPSVASIGSGASLESVISKVNALISALRSIGLIGEM